MGVIFDTAIFENTSVTADFDITTIWGWTTKLRKRYVVRVAESGRYDVRSWKHYSTDSVRKIKENKPDCAVVFGTRKLKPEVINSSKGLLNIHRGIISGTAV